jgi:hypothetical protein
MDVVDMTAREPVRVDGLAQFLTSWFGLPPRPEQKISSDESMIPRALVDGHRLISRWGIQSVVRFNHAVDLDKLSADDNGMVRFWYENQGCWEWATKYQGDDPLVYESEPGGEFEPWRAIGQTVSEFLLSAVIFEAALGGVNRISMREVTGEGVRLLSTSLKPLEIAAESRFMAGTRFFIGPGVLVDIEEPVSPDGSQGQNLYRAWVSARSIEELNLFMQEFGGLGRKPRQRSDSRTDEGPPPW